MPTPSEPILTSPSPSGMDRPPRSVFANFQPAPPTPAPHPPSPPPPDPGHGPDAPHPPTLQEAIDTAFARAFLHGFLAHAFADPTPPGWRWLCDAQHQGLLGKAVSALNDPPLASAAAALALDLTEEAFPSLHAQYLAAFGHAARGRCPLNEIEYGDLNADPLFQPHRLADLAAFYRAFGLEVADDAGERHDHISIQLEFMSVLAAKEVFALEHQLDDTERAVCRQAQRKFLREHLGRWTPAFARRLAQSVGTGPLAALARFTRAFVESECGRFGVRPGSEELLLRPADPAAESLCASCGLAQPPAEAASPGGIA